MKTDKYRAIVILSFPFIFLLGCAAPMKVTYPLKDIRIISESPYSNSSLCIKEFVDQREPLNSKKPFLRHVATVQRGEAEWFHNNDSGYKDKKVAPLITQIVQEHLRATRLFKEVVVCEDGPPQTDFLLEGRIKKFEALKKTSKEAEAGMAFGLLGALATLGLKTEYEAVTIFQARFTDTSTSKILWENEVEGKTEGNDAADPYGWSVYFHANQSLKKAVDELVKNLTSFGG